jgi:hypothetical protein
LEHGANGGGRIACFELFEEIVALQIFLLWDLRVTSKMRSMLEEVVVVEVWGIETEAGV